MPYVITAYKVSHRAVDTLDEAREAAKRIVEDANYTGTEAQAAMSDDAARCEALAESGGAIGPLPDATMIEVRPIPWLMLWKETVPMDGWTDTAIAAYNAAQEA